MRENKCKTELWKPIPDYPNYEISDSGRIKSLPTSRLFGRYMQSRAEKILVTRMEANGYIRTTLCKEGICKHYSVHRLLAEAFIPNPENKPTVNHINGIKRDNRLCNLEWATLIEQMEHADKSGLRNVKGEKCYLSKLKDSDVVDIRTSNCSANELAIRHRVHPSTVRKIRNNKLWRHV